jgi:uncharacterized membrane protein YfcA
MSSYNYYTQEGNQFTLKVQRIYLAIMSFALGVIGFVCFYFAKGEIPTILIGIMFYAFGALVFLRTTSKTIIDTKTKTVTHQPFSFSKPMQFDFKDMDGFDSLSNYSGGIKASTIVGLTFLKGGKRKVINLRQGFMSTKGLHDVVKETQQIINSVK